MCIRPRAPERAHITRAALVALALMTSVAAAEPVPQSLSTAAAPPPVDQPARRYAHGSTSILGGASFTAGLFGSASTGTGFQAMGLSGGVAVRRVTRFGLTLEPRIGIDSFLATGSGPNGIYPVLAARLGLGAGWAFALSRAVAITPMASYEAIYVGGGVTSSLSGVHHLVSAELPLTIFFGQRAFVEVFLRGGAVSALDQIAPAFSAGYRFGLVL